MTGERTEEPTPKRKDDARRKGDVARSRDLVSFVSLAAGFAVASSTANAAVGRLVGLVRGSVVQIGSDHLPDPSRVLITAAASIVAIVGPVLTAMLVAGTVVSYLDSGPVLSLGRVLPKLERIDPSKGVAQLFGKDRFVEIAKSLVVLVVLSAVATVVIRDLAFVLPRLASGDVGDVFGASGRVVVRLVSRVLVVLAGLAVFDFFLSRRQFLAGLRMTKDEVKREYKEADGDPHQKGERARMHREILEHSVLENVRRADVVVVNPTHLAVALRFDEESEQVAPEVIGKGEDELAQKMIEVAREAGVPVLRDIPLARSLYELHLGDEIPEELFEAVAAVLRAAWAEREQIE